MAARKATTVLAALEEYEFIISELSEHTQRGYLSRVGRFARWCEKKHLTLKALTPTVVASYLQEELRKLSEKTGDPLSPDTVHGHMRAIKTFLFWCAKPPQRYLSLDVPQNLIMPKVEIKVIKPFSKEQIEQLKVAVAQNHFPIIVARDRAVLAVLLDTGIRAAELCGLTLENVSITPQDGYLTVRGKGRKQREVPLGRQSRRLLREYIKQYRPAEQGETHVFLSHRHAPLTTSALRAMFKTWKRRAKIKGVRCCPHDCRHTYAINFLLQGGDLYVLSRLMGHSSVAITETYLRAVEALQARKTAKSVLDNL